MFFKYFFWEPAHPKEEEEEFSTTKRVRKPSRSTQKEGVRAAPLKGRRIDRHSTELNLISVNLTNLSQLSFFKFPIFQNMFKSLIWLNFQQKKEWPPHQKEAEESSTTFRWRRKKHTIARRYLHLLLGFFRYFLPVRCWLKPLLFGWGCFTLPSGWGCYLPLSMGGAAFLPLLWAVLLPPSSSCVVLLGFLLL